MALEPITFKNVTPCEWRRIKAGLVDDGIHISTDQGQQEAKGIRISWHYDAESQVLSVQCLGKPLYVPGSLVQARLKSTFSRLTTRSET